MEKEQNNKKQVILTLVAVLTLIVLIGGATYAYFVVGTDQSGFTAKTIRAEADSVGTVTLSNTNEHSNLVLGLSAADMMKKHQEVCIDDNTEEACTKGDDDCTCTNEDIDMIYYAVPAGGNTRNSTNANNIEHTIGTATIENGDTKFCRYC